MVLWNIQQNIRRMQYIRNTLRNVKIKNSTFFKSFAHMSQLLKRGQIICPNNTTNNMKPRTQCIISFTSYKKTTDTSRVVLVVEQTLDGDMTVFCSFLYAFETTYKNMSNINSFRALTLIAEENIKLELILYITPCTLDSIHSILK